MHVRYLLLLHLCLIITPLGGRMRLFNAVKQTHIDKHSAYGRFRCRLTVADFFIGLMYSGPSGDIILGRRYEPVWHKASCNSLSSGDVDDPYLVCYSMPESNLSRTGHFVATDLIVLMWLARKRMLFSSDISCSRKNNY